MTAALTLYAESGWVSPWVFHAMVALEEKGLPYTLTLWPLPIPDDGKATLRGLSGVGKVPILEHGEIAIGESAAISEYLAERFPTPGHPRIFPAALGERARARQVMSVLRTGLFALREQRPTTSVFGAPVSAPLSDAAQTQADELIRLATHALGDRATIASAWCIADADLALALMRLVKNGDPMPDHLRAYALAQWARPSIQVYLGHARAARP